VERWEYFLRLTRWAIDGLAWAWPVTLALLVSLFLTATFARRNIHVWARPKALLQLLPLFIPIVVLVLGSWFACENCSPSSLGQGHRYVWAMRAADGLLALQLVAAVWLVWTASPVRLLSGVFQLLLLWCSLCAALIAGMSISGDWL
jgi:hypothetical protein